jgi:hypothetical protein
MPNFSDLVDETLIALSGYTQRQDQSTYLTANMTDTELTMTVSDAATLSKGLVEVGDELMWIESFDRATNVATIAPMVVGLDPHKNPLTILVIGLLFPQVFLKMLSVNN